MPFFSRNDDHVYCAFDLETTSLVPAASEIIEVAVIRFSGNEILDEFTTLVKPKGSVPEKVIEITGINDGMLTDSPAFEQIEPRITEILKDAFLIAHNAPFDLAFLANAYGRLDKSIPENPTFDTLQLSKRLLPEEKSYKLRDLARNLKCPLPERHRALDDAKFCRELFLILLEKQSEGFEQITTKTITELFLRQGGQMRSADYHPSHLELSDTGKKINEVMESAGTIWVRYSGQNKNRHIAPVYFYPMPKGVTLKAYSILDNKYKDYYLEKVEITEPPEGEATQSPWLGPRNL